MAQTGKNLPTMWETWFHPWARKTPWRKERQPLPAFLPGESHERRSLAAYSPQGREELDTSN